METNIFTPHILSAFKPLFSGGVVIFIIIIFMIFRSYWGSSGCNTYVSNRYLFTPAEWKFYLSLHESLGYDYKVMGKVRVADLLSVDRGAVANRKKWWKAFNKISQKHIDFVLLHPFSGKIVCCIELDDSTHNKISRKKRDIFLNDAFRQAGVPLLRIAARHSYNVDTIRADFKRAINLNHLND